MQGLLHYDSRSEIGISVISFQDLSFPTPINIFLVNKFCRAELRPRGVTVTLGMRKDLNCIIESRASILVKFVLLLTENIPAILQISDI